MRYPFAVTVASLTVFAFIAFVLLSGEWNLGNANASSNVMHIDTVRVHCPFAASDAIDDLPVHLAFTRAVQSVCNGRPNCQIDTPALQGDKDIFPNCSEEWIVHFYCHPQEEAYPVLKGEAHRAFLYEGQRAMVGCSHME